MKIDRTILASNDQQYGMVGDPEKLESSIKHLADVIDVNDDAKTEKLGDHKGTWHGLTPEQAGEIVNTARIAKLEKNYVARFARKNHITLSQSAWTRLEFVTFLADAGNMYKAGSTFVMPEDGYFRFHIQLSAQSAVGSGITVELWQVAGPKINVIFNYPNGANGTGVFVGEAIIFVQAGEEFEFVIKNDAPAPVLYDTYCIVERA